MGLLNRFFARESAADRQEWISSAIRSAGESIISRQIGEIREARRSFEAAETPAWTDSWPTTAAHINEDLARQLPILRSRARAQGRNDEWATNYLIKLDDNVLGENGIRLQMRLKLKDGKADTATNALLESAWEKWGKEADVAGYSWRTAESLSLSALPTDGEFIYRHRPGVGPYGFQIQLIPADLLDVSLHRDYAGNRVRMGVEVNDDGRVMALWLRMAKAGDSSSDLVTIGRHVRVPADQIHHRFLVRETGQLRGYPWLSAGARRLWMLHDFEESAAVASTNAAKRQGFFYSPTGEAPVGFGDAIVSSVLEAAKAAGKVLSADEIKTITDAAEKYATTMPGQFDTLPVGYDFKAFESKWPEISAEGYIKSNIRGWAAARGISYVSVGNDLEAVNYSSAQVGIVAEREHYQTVQGKHREWLHKPVFEAVLPYLILKTPGLKMARLAEYLAAATWQPRRWTGIDPVKEQLANELKLRLKLSSRRRIILATGDGDPDEIAAEIAEEDKLYGPIQTANQAAQTAATATDESAQGKFLA